MWSYRGFRRKQKENDESMRYGVEEVFADPKLENLQPKIQDELNTLHSTIADMDNPKYNLHLIDINYHTQYMVKPDEMVYSALIIYEVRREGVEY